MNRPIGLRILETSENNSYLAKDVKTVEERVAVEAASKAPPSPGRLLYGSSNMAVYNMPT